MFSRHNKKYFVKKIRSFALLDNVKPSLSKCVFTNFSKNYQSGPLSFEYYLDGVKISTNCGFGNNISTKDELFSKLTASQSTLTINDTSITKF